MARIAATLGEDGVTSWPCALSTTCYLQVTFPSLALQRPCFEHLTSVCVVALWLALLLFGFDVAHMGKGEEEGTCEEIGHVWV